MMAKDKKKNNVKATKTINNMGSKSSSLMKVRKR